MTTITVNRAKRRNKRELAAAAALMGQVGAVTLNDSMTPEELSARGRKAARTRWKGHQYSQDPQAIKMRQRRKQAKRKVA